MAKDVQTEAKGADKEQPSEVKTAGAQATTTNGLKKLDVATLAEIVNNKAVRPGTRVAALTEIHGRQGGQYNGLERLETEMLVSVVRDKAVPQVVRAAAADALAIPRPAGEASKSDESDKS